MILFPFKFGNKKQMLGEPLTKEQAIESLIKECEGMVKEACWHPYRTKLNGLRTCLLRIKLAKRNDNTNTTSTRTLHKQNDG